MRRGAAVVVAMMVAMAACGSGTADRGDVLATLSDEAIIPAYVELEQHATTLVGAVATLCADPTDHAVDEARSAMAATRDGWLATEAIWVGPVMERRSWAVVDWPVSVDDVEALIADESIVLDFDRLSRRIGADQRGIQAIEYILGSPSESPVAALGSERRCDYLVGVAQVIEAEVSLLPSDWTVSFEGGPAYRDQFRDVDNGGLDSLVNDALFLLEAMTDAELGNALGLMGESADPSAVVEGPAGLGVADLASRTRGLRAALIGETGEAGIGPLLAGDVIERISEALERAERGLAGLEGPLRDRLVDQTEAVVEIRDALTDVQVLVATEVVGALSVTIGFSDADGDSG